MKILIDTAAVAAVLLAAGPGVAQTTPGSTKQPTQSFAHADVTKQQAQSLSHPQVTNQATQSLSHSGPTSVDVGMKQH
jgi:hypothetical protein